MNSMKNRDDNENLPIVETSIMANEYHVKRDSPASRVRFKREEEFVDQTLSIFRVSQHDAPEQALPTQSFKTLPSSPILSTETKPEAFPSVFERLSNTETVASLHQKISPTKQEIKNDNRIKERTIKRATSAPPKMRTKTLEQKNEIRESKSNKVNGSPTSNSKMSLKILQQDSIDKLANNHTTKILKQKRDEIRKTNNSNLNCSPTSKSSKKNLKILQQESIDRLANNHTALSRSRRRVKECITKENQDKPRSNRSNSLGRRQSLGKKQYLNQRYTPNWRITKSQRIIQVNDTLGEVFDEESAGPPLEIEFSSKMKILCSHKSTPDSGFEELDVIDLGLNSYLAEYAAGVITAKQFGAEIISTLLCRDLPSSNMKWNIRQTFERELAMPLGEIGYSIICEASGKSVDDNENKDDELLSESSDDPFSASVTGNVVFMPDNEIHVENYLCIHDVK